MTGSVGRIEKLRAPDQRAGDQRAVACEIQISDLEFKCESLGIVSPARLSRHLLLIRYSSNHSFTMDHIVSAAQVL
jgi:hypothetical protein